MWRITVRRGFPYRLVKAVKVCIKTPLMFIDTSQQLTVPVKTKELGKAVVFPKALKNGKEILEYVLLVKIKQKCIKIQV